MAEERTTSLSPAKTPRGRKGSRKGAASASALDAAPEVKPAQAPSPSVVTLQPFDRNAMIAQAAYYRAERRQFAPGHELEDWLDAEAEIDALLSANPARHDS